MSRQPVDRKYVESRIKQNGGAALNIQFQSLDFSDADLRGLDLSRAWFINCKFEYVHLGPLVKVFGKELPPCDPNAEDILARWEKGQLADYEEATGTKLTDAVFRGDTIEDSYFYYANMQGVIFNQCRVRGAVFFKSDLRKAIFRFGRFDDVDWHFADLREAKMFSFRLETDRLQDVDWGRDLICAYETERKWNDAAGMYRMLSRAHELAGMVDTAGEFRYREKYVQLQNSLSKAMTARNRVDAYTQWFVDQLFGFGERPWRVLRAALIVTLFFAFWYAEYSTLELSGDGVISLAQRAGRAVYFSLASSTALGYGS